MNDPMARQRAVMERMMQAEERAIDNHQGFIAQARDLEALLDVVNDPDYDMEKFAKDALRLFTAVEAAAKQCKGNVKNVLPR